MRILRRFEKGITGKNKNRTQFCGQEKLSDAFKVSDSYVKSFINYQRLPL